ncbi:MAG: Clp protease N-terminal domain-containing protein, partial [Thermoanaerobaculia bacterium]
MFEKWDEQARRSLFVSRQEATLVGSPLIQPEHILLGLVRENEAAVEKLLHSLGISMQDLRAKIESHPSFIKKPAISPKLELPLSAKAKEVLRVTTSEAEGMHDSAVSCKHLLIGLSKVEDTLAHEILIHSGLNEESLKGEALLQEIEEAEVNKQKSSGSQDAEREIVLIW